MAAQLKASFELRLEDHLSGPLAAMTRRFEALRAMAARLRMDGMAEARGVLDRMGAAADRAGDKVAGIGRRAREAAADLKRLGDTAIRVNAAGVATLPPAMARTAMAAAVLAAASAATVAGRGGLPMLAPPVPRYAPAPLLLGGPGSGIPLAPLNLRGLRLDYLEQRLNALGGTVGRAAERIGVLGSAVAGLSLAVPIQQAAAYDQQLRDIALTGETSRAGTPAEIARLRGIVDPLAVRTGQSGTGLAEAMGVMIGKGMEADLIGKLMPQVAQLATASNADPKMLAALSYTLGQNLRVGPEDMTRTLGGLLIAGKAGGFELKDMAQHFPAVAVAGGTIGMRGASGAASLAALSQVSADVAGPNEPGEAATGMRHLMGMLSSPAGIKHFQSVGVDITRVLTSARLQGIDPLEAVVQKMQHITSGLNPENASAKVGKVFHDEYSRRTMLALMNDPAKYLRIRAAALNTTDADPRRNANAVIGHDFDTQMDGMTRKLAQLEERGRQLLRQFGTEIFAGQTSGPALMLTGIEKAISYLDAHAPGSVKVLANVGAAVIGIVGVLGLVGPVAARGFGYLGTAVKFLLSPLRLLMPVFTAIVAGIGAVATAIGVPFAVAAAIVVAAVAAIAGAAYAIYANWDAVAAWFGRLWAANGQALRGFYEVLAGLFTGDMPRLIEGFKTLWEGLKGFFEVLWEGIKGTFTAFTDWVMRWAGGPLGVAAEAIRRALAPLNASGLAQPPPALGPDGQPLPAAPPDPRRPPMIDFNDSARRQQEGNAQRSSQMDLNIRVDQDGRVRGVTSPTPGVNVRPIDRGDMTGRN